MKNKLFPILFLFPITAGICGASLRANQLKALADGEQNLSTATYGLIIVSVIAIFMALVAALLLKNGITFSCRFQKTALLGASFGGAVVLLAHAAFLLFALQESFRATDLILALFSIYSAVSFIVLGKYSLCERDSSAYCIFSAVPAFWSAFLLILTFRDKIADPIISNYIFLILSYISILFFSYSVTAHILGKNRKLVSVISCFSGIFFIFTEILSLFFAWEFTFSVGHLPLLAFLILMPLYTAEILKDKEQ